MRSTSDKIFVILIIIVTGLLIFFNPLYSADAFITDHLYTRLSGTDSRIVIVGIDEETLSEYGNFNLWSREKTAELIEKLYEDPDNRPAIVGLDFLFTDNYDETNDKRLVDVVAATGADIVAGTNIVYRGRTQKDSKGTLFYNKEYIDNIEMPFEELNEVVVPGFTNECIASDGYVRYAMNSVKVPEKVSGVSGFHDSFAYAVYKIFMDKTGQKAVSPKTNSNGQFQFLYSGESGEFSKVSLNAVLDGKVPSQAFKDAIVLVGAYAPGFQDSYQPASDRGNTMYGVEIHANIIQAYMQGKTMVVVNRILMAFVTALILVLYFVFTEKSQLFIRAAGTVVVAVVYAFMGRVIAGAGLYIPCIYLLLMLAVMDIYFVVDNYQKELKKQMWSFTEAMAAAIDERTPYNASHTRNVAKYSGMIADRINLMHSKGKEKEHFSQNRREQLVMAAFLHDIGKMAVPLSIMNKATRLGSREKDIEVRLEMIRLKARIKMLEDGSDEKEYRDIIAKTEEASKMVEKVNAAGFMDEETRKQLEAIMEYSYDGEPFFKEEEKECLKIVKGTLSDNERKIMESHVTITKKILDKVYFNKYFKNSPKWAAQHHESLDGKGYPNGLSAEQLSTDSRILAVADICDALLATDRPYKKPIPLEKAFDIMRDMAENNKVDGKYVEYLYQCLSENKEE